MSDVILNEQNLYDIADAIREKVGGQTEYLPSEMAEAILSIPTGGGEEGGKTVQYDLGDYFGSTAGSTATTISVSLSGHVGQTAILIIMHRDTLTMPNEWTLIDKHDNPVVSGEEQQSISIYKKTIESSTESYTVTQASSKRICATVIYFKDDPLLEYDETLLMNPSFSNYHYDIAYKDYYRLCVVSDVYAGNQGKPSSNPNIAMNINSSESATISTVRMIAFVNPSSTEAAIQFGTTHSGSGSTDYALNRMFCYKIKASASHGDNLFIPYESRLYSGWYIATISGTSGGKWTEDVADPHCIGISWKVKADHQYIVMAGTNQVSNRWRFGFAHDDLVANPVETVLDGYLNANADSEILRKYTDILTAPYDGYLIGYIGLPDPDNNIISYLLDVTGQDLTGVIL